MTRFSKSFFVGISALGSVWACSSSDGGDACASAAAITERCGAKVMASGGSCTGAAHTLASCAVANEDAYCAFLRQPTTTTARQRLSEVQREHPRQRSGTAPLGADVESFIGTFCGAFLGCCAPHVSGAAQFCPANRRDEATGRRFDPDAAASCLAAVRAADFASSESCTHLVMPDPCRNVFRADPTGSVAYGESCAGPLDCTAPAGATARCVNAGASVDNRKVWELVIEGRKLGEACGLVDEAGAKIVASCAPSLDCRHQAMATSAPHSPDRARRASRATRRRTTRAAPQTTSAPRPRAASRERKRTNMHRVVGVR